ncbi:hypothetical protein [Thermoflavimicrobium dichotomicum]|uniref:hypothetical protein n=1 Tax=Thermoflavimicrobium dichotomicum TaxID=46223 RepID=UPI0015878778|nr:hypothetical protein [Thermoflavimicrobium dichotomicum]
MAKKLVLFEENGRFNTSPAFLCLFKTVFTKFVAVLRDGMNNNKIKMKIFNQI